MRLAAAVAAGLIAASSLRAQPPRNDRPVAVIADSRIQVGSAGFPLYVSRDWSAPLPDIRRAVLVLHGYLRNADVYYRSALKAQAAAGPAGAASLMIAPQFLAGLDIAARGVADDVLHWSLEGWEGGEPAEGPTDASSFDALDAILMRLSNRHLFPNLQHIVVAGHSGGGQVVQRYAILGQGEAADRAVGITVRYVVANPSSYAWFTPDRPRPAIAAACPGYDQWKYGMHDLPPYAAGQAAAVLEMRYASRDVVYLLGTADTNPNHPALDKSCTAESQGPYRYARGHAYFAAMQQMFGPVLRQAEHDVPGVGHDGDRMLTSACGLAALFDVPGCASKAP